MKSRKRMDGVAEEVTKQVEMSKLVEPKFLTLTGKPANQVAFKVVRDDSTGETTMAEKAPIAPERRRRIRSTQRSSLLFIEFPEGCTDDDVAATAEEYGLTEYEITVTSDGRKCLKRSDLTEIPTDALTVMIGEGRRAGVVRSEQSVVNTSDTLPFIEIAAIEFDKETFTEVSAVEYLKRYDIDFLEKGVENTDKLIRIVRSDTSEDTEVRRVEVETGVVAVVTRAAVQEVTLVSSPFTEVVCEECFGQWGWGQLDFNAMMADIEFCEAAEDASYRLRNLVERILFYSQLPVAARKELINRAATQFAAFIGSLLDALPAKVILVNRSNLEKLKEQKSMNQRVDETKLPEGDGAAKEGTAAPEAAKDEQAVTRSEVAQMVAEGVKAGLAAYHAEQAAATAKTEEVTRSEGETKEGDDAQGKLLSSVETVARSVEGLATTMESMAKRMEAIEGATTVRSDGSDSATAAPKKDVFQGVFASGRK